MSKKFACGITVYGHAMSVLNRIEEYSNCFELVYVFDNTESNCFDYEFKNIISDLENVIYLGDGSNHGLPYAFNRIIELIPTDIDYLCTLDQDSFFSSEDIQAIERIITLLPDDNKYGIIAPHIVYNSTKFDKTNTIRKVRYAITSGSFLSMSVIRKYSICYDEAYFIDKFEIDLCEQIKNRGFIIGCYDGSVLYQQLGEPDSKGRSNHSALRHYYLFRNRFYFNSKFYSIPKRQIFTILQLVKHIAIILFREENKISKIAVIPRAYLDYRHHRMGKINQ